MGITKGEKRQQKTNEYTIIEQLTPFHSVTLLCQLAGVSRSGYYKWLHHKSYKSAKQIANEDLMKKIMECHSKLRGIYGYLRVQVWLYKTYGLRINHKRVYRLMKRLGIRSMIRRKRPYYGRQEAYVISTNTLNREFQASRPNEKWVTDITYLPIHNKFLYLSTIFDLFNNEVVTYKISFRNDLTLVLDTVRQAVDQRNAKGVLLHSDQGFQYTSRGYNRLLEEHQMKASMSRKGNCYDNACMESFFGHLKSECVKLQKFETEEQLIEAVHNYIKFYNNERFQKKLNNLSPVQYRTKAA